jgi:thiamine transporter
MKNSGNIRALAECSVLVALSSVLSLIKIWQMPLGGSITLLSMLPVCVIPIRRGLRWGLGSAFVYSLIQLGFGIVTEGLLGWGLSPVMLAGCILFDYLLGFSVLGLAGAFRKRGQAGVYAGLALAFGLRFLSHLTSGYVIFRNLDQWEVFGMTFADRPLLYSACYNGFFMLPELVITLSAVFILMRFTYIRTKVLAPVD